MLCIIVVCCITHSVFFTKRPLSLLKYVSASVQILHLTAAQVIHSAGPCKFPGEFKLQRTLEHLVITCCVKKWYIYIWALKHRTDIVRDRYFQESLSDAEWCGTGLNWRARDSTGVHWGWRTTVKVEWNSVSIYILKVCSYSLWQMPCKGQFGLFRLKVWVINLLWHSHFSHFQQCERRLMRCGCSVL